MKKVSSVISVIIILFTVAFIAVPKPASAITPVTTKVWEVFGEGVMSEVVPMYSITTKPQEWYQLKSDGIKLDGASQICYPFDEGRFGWTGAIFQMVEDAWVKLATNVGWVPNEEGTYKACAQAPAAGTYALFAYFDLTKAPVVACDYDTSSWSIGIDSDGGGDYFYASVDNLPFGTYVSYVLIGMSPAGSVTGAMSGNGTVGNLFPGDADFLGYNVVIDPSADFAVLRITAAGCVKDLIRSFDET